MARSYRRPRPGERSSSGQRAGSRTCSCGRNGFPRAPDWRSGYFEGSLARIIEAAFGQAPVLPSVKNSRGFLCGTEFSNLAKELRFFAERGLCVDAAEIGVCLHPGELLVFDNLMLAHGRRGTRQGGELRQRVFGHQTLSVEQQAVLRDRVLAAFTS